MAANMSEIIAQLPLPLQEQVPLYEETLRPNMYAGIGISLFLVYVCVGLRIYGRRLQGISLWWDDHMSIVAAIFATVSSAVLLYLTYVGFGRHVIVMILEHPNEIGTFLNVLIASDALYFPSICFSKLSILFQYRRLFPDQRFKWVLVAVGVASTASCIIDMSVITATCLPVTVPTLEDPLAQTLACSNIEYMLIWICSWNSVLDFIILLLPMPHLWRLNTTFRRKVQLTFVFLFGSFVVAISIIRTWYFTKLDFNDTTWSGSLGNMWTEVEGCMSIVAGCFPAMVPVFRGCWSGRRKPEEKGTPNVNLVTFGSKEKKKILRDVSFTMTSTVNHSPGDDGSYTVLPDQGSQENQAQYYMGSQENPPQYYMGSQGNQPQYYVSSQGNQPQYYVGSQENQPQYYVGGQENQPQYYMGNGRW